MASSEAGPAPTLTPTPKPVIPPYVGEDFFPDDIPEQLKDDCLVAYLRCRYSTREKLRSGLETDKQERINRELERIADLRKTFEAEDRNKTAMEIFCYRQIEWRIHAIKSREDYLNNLNAKLDMMMAQNKPKLTAAERPRRFELEKLILSAVGNWERATLPPTPNELGGPEDQEDSKSSILAKFMSKFKKEPLKSNSNLTPNPEPTGSPNQDFHIPDDSYGISITKVTLKRSHEADSPFFQLEDTQRYPLKEILEDAPTNPLKKCDGTDTIRYFHFPANNMHWIEVSFTSRNIKELANLIRRRRLHASKTPRFL